MANIILKAFDPRSKWAYIEENKTLFLIRPPFGIGDKISASEQNLSNALQKMFYIVSDENFRSIDKVISFLKKNAKNPTRNYTKEEQEQINKDYLLSLPKAAIELFLEDLEEEIPTGDPNYFLELLDIVSQNTALQTEKKLKEEIVNLQERLQKKAAQKNDPFSFTGGDSPANSYRIAFGQPSKKGQAS